MKLVLVDNGIVTDIYKEIHDPQIDRYNNVILHSNGKVYGFKEEGREILIVHDYVPVEVGDDINKIELREYDQSDHYDQDLSERLKDGFKNIKEDIKDLFD